MRLTSPSPRSARRARQRSMRWRSAGKPLRFVPRILLARPRSGHERDHPERPRARDRHPGVREAGEGPLGRGPAEDLREAPRDQAAHGPVLRGDHRDPGGAGEVSTTEDDMTTELVVPETHLPLDRAEDAA